MPMIDPHSPTTQLTLPLHIPEWLQNHALASPAFVWWYQPFIEDEDEQF